MAYLLAAETLVLALLGLLVAGLLRSHAEILRRLEGASGVPAARDPVLPALAAPRDGTPAGSDIAGETLSGDAVQIAVSGGSDTVLAFLTSGCEICAGFWEALRSGGAADLPAGSRLVVVVRDSSHESPSRLRRLAPEDVDVVMSSASWDAYAVPLAPYVVLVGGDGRVRGEGAASEWRQVVSLLDDALADARDASAERPRRGVLRVDHDLRQAGIGAGHPSLWTGDDVAGRPAGEAPA